MFIIIVIMMCYQHFEVHKIGHIINPIFTTLYIMLIFSAFLQVQTHYMILIIPTVR